MALNVYVNAEDVNAGVIKYTFATICFNKSVECTFVDSNSLAQITIGISAEDTIRVSKNFFTQLQQGTFSNTEVLNANGLITCNDGATDYLSTIYYYINSLQEYNSSEVDELGRFKYKASLQYKWNCVDQNKVQLLINEFWNSIPQLAQTETSRRNSTVFLTHDIDSIYGAIKEDGFYALKNLQIGAIFRLMMNTAMSRPDWLNMDKIMAIEDEYGFRSTFYWLLIKGAENSDYNFKSELVQSAFKNVKQKGWENGLHKSMGGKTFAEEMSIYSRTPNGNRFHYLKFALPQGYDEIEQSKIPLDTSLGFSEVLGFRNSYGLPFMPYNLKQNRVYNFVEVPQLIMDRTFFREKKSVAEIKKQLIDFFEANNYNTVFTINWHNNFFTHLKYGGYLQLYKDILAYFRDNNTAGITQSELIKEYYKPELYRF